MDESKIQISDRSMKNGQPKQSTLHLFDFIPGSLVNGPGKRAVIWFQGCTLNCPGCFNPESHSQNHGRLISVTEIAEQILSNIDNIEGITISGGEPFQQAVSLLDLLRIIRENSHLSIIVFSGYTLEEIHQFPGSGKTIELIDVLIAGRYKQDERFARGLLGSRNKKLHFISNRYQPHHFDTISAAEVIISNDGEITSSGIDPLVF